MKAKDYDVHFSEIIKNESEEEKPVKKKKRKRPKIFDLSAISIIACDCLQAVICIYIDLFFISKVLDVDSGDISTNIIKIGLFYAIYYTILASSYAISGHVLRRIKKNVFVIIGSILLAFVVLTVFLLGDDVTSFRFVPVLAVMYGISFGFFSSGYNNLTAETISSKHQVRFFAVKRILFQMTYIIFPATLGVLADIDFTVTTFVMFFVVALLIVFSFLIKPKKSYKLSFHLREFSKFMRKNKESTKPLWLVYISNFFRGASYDCFTTLITILVIQTFKTNTSLGTFQSIFTACSLLTMFFYLRYYRKKRAGAFIGTTIALVSCTIVGILSATNQVSIVIFYAVYTILNVILMSISDSRRSGVVRVLSLHSHILESNALAEFFLGAGRVLSSSLVLFAGLFDMLMGNGSTIFLKVALGIVCLMYVMYGISLIWLERALVKQDEEFRKAHISEVIEKNED